MNFRELRRGMIVLKNTIEKLKSSRPLSLAFTSAEKSMMWTGTYMKFSELGDNPYAKHDGKRETVEHIEPMFDATSDSFNKEIMDRGTIYVVDQMRTYIAKQLETITIHISSGDREKHATDNALSAENYMQGSVALFNIQTNLTEVRLWLGMELGRIRDEAE